MISQYLKRRLDSVGVSLESCLETYLRKTDDSQVYRWCLQNNNLRLLHASVQNEFSFPSLCSILFENYDTNYTNGCFKLLRLLYLYFQEAEKQVSVNLLAEDSLVGFCMGKERFKKNKTEELQRSNQM